MNVIFAGTPEFAASVLSRVLETHHVSAVLTQPDRPAGRGRRLAPSAVKQIATARDIPILQPVTLKRAEIRHTLREFDADAMIVVAYGLMLPETVLGMPRYGCINVHASLLPRWRGAAPIQHAILAGDARTGISIMQMDRGLDTGPVLAMEAVAIQPTDTAQTLLDRLSVLGGDLLLRTLRELEAGRAVAVPQPEDGACYAAKITKHEAVLDWNRPAAVLERCVRAYNPWPVAHSAAGAVVIRVWRAEAIAHHPDVAPGTVITIDRHGIDVATGGGVLRITELQLPGGTRLPVSSFVNASRGTITPGMRLSWPP